MRRARPCRSSSSLLALAPPAGAGADVHAHGHAGADGTALGARSARLRARRRRGHRRPGALQDGTSAASPATRCRCVERIRREQLDGVFSGGMLCMRAAPSMRVMRVLGLFQGRDELDYVLGRLKPTHRRGVPQRRLRQPRRWSASGPSSSSRASPCARSPRPRRRGCGSGATTTRSARALDGLGFTTVRADAARRRGALYDEGKVDGFVAVPTAALAFQWSARAKLLLPLRLGVARACVIITNRAFDPLPDAWQGDRAQGGGARASACCEELGREQDDALLGGLFAKQGLTIVPLVPETAPQFFFEARALRDKLPSWCRRRCSSACSTLLADYRAEHRDARGAATAARDSPREAADFALRFVDGRGRARPGRRRCRCRLVDVDRLELTRAQPALPVRRLGRHGALPEPSLRLRRGRAARRRRAAAGVARRAHAPRAAGADAAARAAGAPGASSCRRARASATTRRR